MAIFKKNVNNLFTPPQPQPTEESKVQVLLCHVSLIYKSEFFKDSVMLFIVVCNSLSSFNRNILLDQ